MPNLPDPFAFLTPRRMLRVNLFIWKWLMRLLSASVEAYLRGNFGRRYLRRLLLAVLFCTGCVGLAPRPAFSSALFLCGLYAFVAYHAAHVFTRRSRGEPEPHTFSAGDSWPVWRRFALSQTVVQRYVEPGLCVLASLPLAAVDPFLHAWLTSSAAALFIKEQISRIQETRRVLDAMDARHEAQALNAALNARQQPRAQAAQKAHRAHLPGAHQQRHP